MWVLEGEVISFVYLQLHWVFGAVCGLSLAASGVHSVAVQRLLIVVASLTGL